MGALTTAPALVASMNRSQQDAVLREPALGPWGGLRRRPAHLEVGCPGSGRGQLVVRKATGEG